MKTKLPKKDYLITSIGDYNRPRKRLSTDYEMLVVKDAIKDINNGNEGLVFNDIQKQKVYDYFNNKRLKCRVEELNYIYISIDRGRKNGRKR